MRKNGQHKSKIKCDTLRQGTVTSVHQPLGSSRKKNKMFSIQLCCFFPPPLRSISLLPITSSHVPPCHHAHSPPLLRVSRPSRLSSRVFLCGLRARGQGESSSAKCKDFCHPNKDKVRITFHCIYDHRCHPLPHICV